MGQDRERANRTKRTSHGELTSPTNKITVANRIPGAGGFSTGAEDSAAVSKSASTIDVAPGTYRPVVITVPVVLQGPNATIRGVDRRHLGHPVLDAATRATPAWQRWKGDAHWRSEYDCLEWWLTNAISKGLR
jgi:hypothetical protein